MEILHNGRALLIGDEKIDSKVLDLYPNLQIIGCPMTGLDHIDLKECKNRAIKVISLQGERKFLDNIFSTAEHTIGLMIALLRNYKIALNPPYKVRDEYMGHILRGKKLLLIGGMGRIGTQVSKIAEAFGMNVYIIDSILGTNIWATWIEKILRIRGQNDFLDDLKLNLSEADIVSIHIPLVGNEGFFTKEMFEQMNSSAYFINTSRSKVVEDGALEYALKNKLITGAAIDFIDDENLVEFSKTNQNLILTNHIGGVTYEDRKTTKDFIKEEVENYIGIKL